MSHGKKESQSWSRRVGAQRACNARGRWFGGGVAPGGGGAQPGNRGPDCGPRLAHPFVHVLLYCLQAVLNVEGAIIDNLSARICR